MSANRQSLNTERRWVRLPKLGLIIAAFILSLVILILAHSWTRSKHFVSPIEILLGTPPAAVSRKATEISQGDVTVYMPANATELDGSISISVAQPNLLLAVENTKWIIPEVVSVEFRRPDGVFVPDISFSEPLEVCFNLAEDHWQAFMQDQEAYQVQYYADQKNPSRWESLPQVTHPDQHQLCGQTYKLSMFGLAIQVKVGIPVTGLTAGLAQALLIPPAATREHRDRDTSTTMAPQVIATNPPTNSPATQPPVVQPQPTDPPPAEPPVVNPPVDPPAKEKQPPPGQEKKDQQPPPGQQKKDQQPPPGQQNKDQPKDKKKN
jgi:hypothetical protein